VKAGIFGLQEAAAILDEEDEASSLPSTKVSGRLRMDARFPPVKSVNSCRSEFAPPLHAKSAKTISLKSSAAEPKMTGCS